MASDARPLPDFLGYKGTRAMVTGGSSGIGRAVTVALAAYGANVIVVGRREVELSETIQLATDSASPGTTVGMIVADLADEAAPAKIMNNAVAQLGGLDLLVNGAAMIYREQTEDEITSEDVWNRLMQTNVRAPYLMSKEAVPSLRERNGSIVNISSIWAHVGAKKQVAYSTSKAAILELTRSMALDFAKDGIRVNCVCPSTIRTPLIYRGRDFFDEELVRSVHPLGRIGEPADVANAVLYLGSNKASGWITGIALTVDGGYIAC